MIEHDADELPSGEMLKLAELAEQITQRIESGEPLSGNDSLAPDPTGTGPIHQLLPTLRAMVSVGEQINREQGRRTRQRKKSEGPSE